MRLCHLPSSKVLSLCLLFYGTRLGKPLNKVIEGAFGFKACKAVAFCKDLEPEALARALSPRVATAGASSDCRLSASVQGPSPAVLQQACSETVTCTATLVTQARPWSVHPTHSKTPLCSEEGHRLESGSAPAWLGYQRPPDHLAPRDMKALR